MSKTDKKSVLVIGGGWCGLYALKHFLQEGLDAVLYEKTDQIGGVWVYREDKPGGCYLKTRTTASKCYLHASDYPMPDTVGHFPNHVEVLKFLNDYTDHFNLRKHIQTNITVHKVRKTKDGKKWKVVFYRDAGDDYKTTGKREIEYYDFISASSGQHQNPYMPTEEDPWKNYTGEVTHSHYYKYPTPDLAEKSVCIVGGGESASDVAAEVCEIAKKTYMSIRQGVWFQDRTVGAHQPADMVFTKHQRLMGFSDYQSWLVWIGRYIMIELMWGKGGSGVDVWQPSCRYFHGFLNKSRDVIDKVALGKVEPRGGAIKIEGKKVWFRGRTEPDVIDKVIFATGFRASVSYLNGEQSYTRAYKLVFDPVDPTICYIGSPRPMIGSIPALAELQARWAAKVYSGKVALPSSEEMLRVMKYDHERHKKIFPQDDHSLPQLVNHWAYSDEIGAMFGAKPNLVRWFFRNPFKWWTIISAPWSAHIYLTEEPKEREQALKNIEKTYLPGHFPFHLFNHTMLLMDISIVLIIFGIIYLFVRFLFF